MYLVYSLVSLPRKVLRMKEFEKGVQRSIYKPEEKELTGTFLDEGFS
jgi:hypothetical protein